MAPAGSAGLKMIVLMAVAIACCCCGCRGASTFQFPAAQTRTRRGSLQHYFAATTMNHPQRACNQNQHQNHRTMLWKILSIQEDENDERANEGSLDEPPTTTTTFANTDGTSSPNALKSTIAAEEENDGRAETKVDSQAEILHALAVKTRLEAEKMELLLTLDKISRLENNRILSSSSNATRARVRPDEERANLIRNARALMTKLDGSTDLATKSSLILGDNDKGKD